MRQLLQNLKTGELTLADVPEPVARPGALLIRSRSSLISPGTERMLVEFARASLVEKALRQPERVRQVLDKVRAEGLIAAAEAVRSRLDEPLALGYCNSGVVAAVGAGVTGWAPGDRVASNGPHAEVVCVPQHLCARVPEAVGDEPAAFTVLGAIGLQGIRLLAPALGETVAVYGLGLIGQLSARLLRASGCRVIGIDRDAARCALAEAHGAASIDAGRTEEVSEAVLALTHGRGVDGVLIAAAAHKDQIVRQSARMCRQRGRIVLVGVADLELDRADFYAKEITFQVSCSYGPGRYDEAYEAGHDYPYGLVRWTEQRNLGAVLDCLADGRLDVADLIGERVPFSEAGRAYASLGKHLAVLLGYADPPGVQPIPAASVAARSSPASDPRLREGARRPAQVRLGLIGAGNFARRTLGPVLKSVAARLETVAAPSPVAAADVARRCGFARAVSDPREVLEDPGIDAVIIATRHDSHAALTVAALDADKHVLVEKPLCLTRAELAEVRSAHERAQHRARAAGRPAPILHVGFNRRFAPASARVRELLAGRTGPLCMSALINAGTIPPGSWVHDARIGGGRIIGEGCHWIDLLRFFAGAPITAVTGVQVGGQAGDPVSGDKAAVTLAFADGSIGSLLYFANGHRGYPKETITLFGEGRVLRLDNFRRLTGHGWRGLRGPRALRPEKGHREQLAAFVERVQSGGEPLIPFEEIENVTLASFAAAEATASGGCVEVLGAGVATGD